MLFCYPAKDPCQKVFISVLLPFFNFHGKWKAAVFFVFFFLFKGDFKKRRFVSLHIDETPKKTYDIA